MVAGEAPQNPYPARYLADNTYIPSASSASGIGLGGSPIFGQNALQSASTNWLANNLVNSPVSKGADYTNSLLSWVGKRFTNLDEGPSETFPKQVAPQLSAPTLANTSTSAEAPSIDAPTGASIDCAYSALYSRALIDPSLAAYDYGTDRAFSALDARTAGAGAFGNTRSGLGYSDLGAQIHLRARASSLPVCSRRDSPNAINAVKQMQADSLARTLRMPRTSSTTINSTPIFLRIMPSSMLDCFRYRQDKSSRPANEHGAETPGGSADCSELAVPSRVKSEPLE